MRGRTTPLTVKARSGASISEPQRVVFTLFEVDELDGREIATLLNISIGTVRSRLRYARKLFRREVRRRALANAFPKPGGG